MVEQYIKTEEFQDYIMKYINSEELDKVFKATSFYDESNSTRFFEAMQYGIVWASILMGSS